MFRLLDIIYKFVGNFGVAILIVTVLVKAAFFPLANKSYASMAKMKAVQPQMAALQEQYPDDRVKQQQELMELYKREKINPLAGCLPVVLQIPVFFGLYKVLFVTIEMRHAPFFGWIKDLVGARPDDHLQPVRPDPLDAAPRAGARHLADHHGLHDVRADEDEPGAAGPIQKTMFTWMPVFFTYLLGLVPAGCDLLVLEQHALGDAAVHDHEAPG